MHSIYNAEGAHHLPSFRDLDFSLVSEIVNGVPLDVNSLATGTVLVTVTKKSLAKMREQKTCQQGNPGFHQVALITSL
jgi:hypothetical protein